MSKSEALPIIKWNRKKTVYKKMIRVVDNGAKDFTASKEEIKL